MISFDPLHRVQRAVLFRAVRARDALRAVATLALLGSSVACADPDPVSASDVEPGGAAIPRRDPICASCKRADAAGDETSDLSDSQSACTADRAALPTDPAALAAVNHLREAYSGPLALTMRWSERPPGGDAAPFYEAAPSGYEPAAQVSIDVVLGDTEYYVGRSRNPADSLDCPDGFRVPATVSIATADGALEVEARGSFSTIPGNVGNLRAYADLADAVGSLDLHLQPDRAYSGTVHVDVLALNEGKRGNLGLSMDLDDRWSSHPLAAAFPDDGCDGIGGFPVAPDEALPAWGGASAAQLVADWQASLAPLRADAVWADCTPVDLQFELGTASQVCAGTNLGQARGQLRFDAENHFVTSDGRLDTVATRGLITPERLSIHTVDPIEQILSPEFAATAGIRGVDPGTSPWLTHAVSATFQRAGGDISASGIVRVEGLECSPTDCNAYRYRETLDWPRDSVFAPYCE